MREQIVILDADPFARLGLKTLLDSPQVNDIYELETYQQLSELSPAICPHLLLLDSVPLCAQDVDTLTLLRQRSPTLKIVAISPVSYFHIFQCKKIAIQGYLPRSAPMSEIILALARIRVGKTWYTRALLEHRTRYPYDAWYLDTLSAREMAVFRALTQGKINKTIAQEMQLSSKTVSTYKIRVMHKLHVKGLKELMRFADRNHIH